MYFFDSYALIEAYLGNPAYRKFQDEVLTTTVLNLCEVHYHFLKEGKESQFKEFYEKTPFEFLEITPEESLQAARFRFEMFNAFNRVNFTGPDGNRSSGNFMRTRAAFDPRILQFALRLDW